MDAALDFRNVSIIGHYIEGRCKGGQFIIISLRNNMVRRHSLWSDARSSSWQPVSSASTRSPTRLGRSLSTTTISQRWPCHLVPLSLNQRRPVGAIAVHRPRLVGPSHLTRRPRSLLVRSLPHLDLVPSHLCPQRRLRRLELQPQLPVPMSRLLRVLDLLSVRDLVLPSSCDNAASCNAVQYSLQLAPGRNSSSRRRTRLKFGHVRSEEVERFRIGTGARVDRLSIDAG